MNPIIENITGTADMTDQVVATDLLITAKTGVWNYSVAITETASPEVRAVLRKQLEDAIETHELVSKYMLDQGWYHAYNPQEQIALDLQNAQTALNIQ
ncbi:spore coat protein [Alicyclobacillus fastidiosus]|uniref:Spore coat protein n=1 Tax=Alicyclobacillus fastidiosus TaxID=392011 RepID=A0ABV5AHU5_9BACL|nr:spore coat protein [Alicyclobacillus fastidiosus]WEH11591.1 spore coat protein [Alicyclobacillus fastidiosus]